MKKTGLLRTLAVTAIVSLMAVLMPATPARAIGIITIDVDQGSIGQVITVTGSGFYGALAGQDDSRGVHIIFGSSNPGATIDYAIDRHEIVKIQELNSNGTFSTTFLVPTTLTGATLDETVTDGIYYVYLTYYYPATPTIKGLNILDITTFTIATGETAVSPATGTVGSQTVVSGTGFGGSEALTFQWDGTVIAIAGGDSSTKVSGTFDTTITIPPSTAGTHTIKVSDAAPSVSDEVSFIVTPKMSVSPTSGTAGTSIDVTGSGFAGATAVTLYFNDIASGQVTTDSKGSFTGSITPSTSSVGAYSIAADDGTNSATAGFSVTATSFDISPTTGKAGTTVTANGSGYQPSLTIFISFNSVNVANPISNSSGAFIARFDVPVSAVGTYDVTATDGTNTNKKTFTIISTGVVSPVTSTDSPGKIGSELTLSGDGFAPAASITITYDGETIATATAGSDGSYSVNIVVPKSTYGEHSIIATDGTNSLDYSFLMESNAPSAPPPLTPENKIKAEAAAFFDWEDVTDDSGLTYSIQIATDANFPDISLVVNESGLASSEYSISEENALLSVSEEAPYYWHVRAIDGAGNESPWTGVRSFYVGGSFKVSQGVIYSLIAVGALILAAFSFWMGRKTAYY